MSSNTRIIDNQFVVTWPQNKKRKRLEDLPESATALKMLRKFSSGCHLTTITDIARTMCDEMPDAPAAVQHVPTSPTMHTHHVHPLGRTTPHDGFIWGSALYLNAVSRCHATTARTWHNGCLFLGCPQLLNIEIRFLYARVIACMYTCTEPTHPPSLGRLQYYLMCSYGWGTGSITWVAWHQ